MTHTQLTSAGDDSFHASQPFSGLMESEERSTGQSIKRGAFGKCPACGEGRLFSGYLKVKDQCDQCHAPMHHQRADDGPAYLTVLIVSHLIGPILLAVFVAYRPSPMTMLIGFGLGAILASLALLPLIKGGMVGLQWARRMHGFGIDAEPISS